MDKKMYDLTAPQKSIWLTEQYYTNSNVNNVCGTAVVSGILDFDVLKKAIIYLLENNDIFRLHFTEENGVLKQYFGENYPYDDIELVELNSENEIHDLEQKLLSRVFSITEQLYEIKMFKVKNSNTSGCLINIHHILCDAFSAGNICQKALKAYTQLIAGETLTIDNKYSYENYLISEKEYYNSQKFIKDKEYWDEMFKTVPNIVTIPSNQKDYSDISYKANRYNYLISKEKMNKIIEFCANSKISVFNLFMGILSIYMHRINNMNDFVIGTPILNRTNFNEKNTLGMFINVAPLRINIDDTSSIFDLFSNIATNSMGLLRHQKYSYQSILENVRKTNPAIPNLYNIVLSYQITKTTIESNLSYETNWAFNGTTLNDIEIHLYDVNNTGELNIAYDYKVDKYSEQDIIDVNKRLNYLIDQVLENSDLKIQDLEIVTPEERDLILNVYNNTKLKYDENLSIIKSFENQVNLTPNLPALTFKNETFTYSELNSLANQLANTLIEKGITNNSIVAILLNRSAEVIISILAILKAGGAYLPIDSDYPSNRIDYILSNSKCDLVLYKDEKLDYLKNYNTLNININDLNKNILVENPNITTNPDNLSYIIYTSGSTGTPKGVTLTQKNYSNFLASMKNKIDYLNDNINHSIISITTISFDIFNFETIISLCNGLHLYFTDYFEQKQTTLLEKYITTNDIEIIQTTPSIFYHHLNNLENKNSFSNLKYIILAGEPLTEKIVNAIKQINPNCTIYNGYGPSETTIFSTICKITDSEHIVIGEPINNTQIYILDDNQKLLPPLIPGELYISGDGVGNGYLNKPELTNDSFLKNTFGSGKTYKSGDLGYWDKKGKLHCLGRKDTQIKLHGLRIELSEIENKINTFLKNDSRCCILLQNNENNSILHAFIESSTTINLSELKNYLLLNLPNYMIPHKFTILEKFPQTPNGKIDKKQLNLIKAEANIEKIIEKPCTKTEQILYDIISKYINIENYSIIDDFFSIGLDSLTLINILMDINTKFNISLSMHDIYNKLNIKKLAEFLDNYSFEKNNDFIKFIKTSNSYPTSSAQKRIFYTSNISNSKTGVYNLVGGIEFSEKLDIEKINKCFKQLINRHEAFRTYFEIIDGEISQKIVPSLDFKIEIIETTTNDINNQFNLFNTNFTLEKAPLLKAKILYLENDHTLLFINMHHIIADGTSMQILLDEFCKIYNNEQLPNNKFTYKDFINYEQYFSGSDKYKKNQDFWLNEFSNEIPTLNLPTNHIRPSIFSYNGAKICNTINKDLTNQILEFSKKMQITPYMFLLSAYYILLYKYTNQNDIIIGTPTANRNITEFSKIIGMFVNTLAIRKTISSEKTFEEFAAEVKEKCLNCFAHQAYPFDELVKKLNLFRDVSRNPLFDTMFIYQNDIMKTIKFNNTTTKFYLPDTKISKFDISLEIVPQENTFDLNIEYCTDLFDREFIKNLSTHYIKIIKNIIKAPNTAIKNITMLSIKEKHHLKNFNITDLNIPRKNTLVNRFYNIVKKYPQNIAVEINNKKITYKELDELSNFLSQELIKNGIQSGDVVGVCLNKSLELIISIWAILKIGAIYMPIYSKYPKDRIEYMILNSKTKLLITNSGFENNIDLNISKIILNNINDLQYLKILDDSNIKINYNDTAYIIYTSGSTGKPKGVQIKHSNLVNFIYAFNKYYKNKITENDAFLSSTNISFDVSIWEIFLPLLNGAKLVLYNEEVITDIVNYSNYILDNKITGLYIPPNILNDVFVLLQNKDIYIEKLLVGVEPIKKSTLNKYFELNPNMIIINGYGPTETTICATALNYKKDTTNDNIVSIGRPLYNNNIYILDSENNLMPIGVPRRNLYCRRRCWKRIY